MDVWAIVLGVATIIGMLLAIPAAWDFVDVRRGQVKSVTARIDQSDRAVGGDYRHRTLEGGRLTIRNSGARWPVHEVMLIAPNPLTGLEIGTLGASEDFVKDVPQSAMQEMTDRKVVLQLKDRNGKLWSWSPQDQRLHRIPKRLNPLAAVVQRSSGRWPQSWHQRFQHLPTRLKKILWGYDPAGSD